MSEQFDFIFVNRFWDRFQSVRLFVAAIYLDNAGSIFKCPVFFSKNILCKYQQIAVFRKQFTGWYKFRVCGRLVQYFDSQIRTRKSRSIILYNQIVTEIVGKNKELIQTRGRGAMGALMGDLMKIVGRGAVDGKILSSTLNQKMAPYLPKTSGKPKTGKKGQKKQKDKKQTQKKGAKGE